MSDCAIIAATYRYTTDRDDDADQSRGGDPPLFHLVLALESPLVFYPGCLRDILVKARGYWSVYRRSRAMLKTVLEASDRWTYTDLSIAPPHADEFDNLDLYHATSGGEAALARKRRDDALREKAH